MTEIGLMILIIIATSIVLYRFLTKKSRFEDKLVLISWIISIILVIIYEGLKYVGYLT